MTTQEEIRALFDLWNDALKTQDPKKVTALYADDGGILLPTLSNDVRHNPDEIDDYFIIFCQKRPVATMIESNMRIFDGVAVNSGACSFELDADDGTRVNVRVRFSFTYEKRSNWPIPGPDWRIISHHSSVFPEDG